ncbi:AbiU2 domain-containing protein [Duganella radicis]|uniref:HEPN AbiU2-like domain-containing protein n=1 Tax=Duganella radicis TaxID=551988 RepID=A0A6L6PIA2_9BURK|nr:hypothetical protein [Duganella radicis]MTV38459.1 hypothetical protein [Duganella radicis]
MAVADYEYTVEQCDVSQQNRGRLTAYRTFRRKCLDYIRADSRTSVATQIHNLAWHTAVFKTLNEARRIEPEQKVNAGMWNLISAGYFTMVTLGVRRLVDHHAKTDSIWNVLEHLEKHPELLTRENYVCYDGVPFDHAKAFSAYVAMLEVSDESGDSGTWLPAGGPDAWDTSQLLHKAFDRLAGAHGLKKRTDKIPAELFAKLKDQLRAPAIERVRTLADRSIAHAERISPDSPVPVTTFDDVEEALRIIVRVTNFLSASVFYDAAFGSVVPTPQYDVLANLDAPWISSALIPDLRDKWREVCNSMNTWADDIDDGFLLELS